MTVRPLRSMMRVAGPRSASISAVAPTLTMRCPRTASAWAMVKRSFTVTTLPLTRNVSAGCASAIPVRTASARRTRLCNNPIPPISRCRPIHLRSIDIDSGLLDHDAPFVDFRPEKFRKLARGRTDDRVAPVLQFSFDRGVGQRGDGIGVHLFDDVWRCFGGYEQ